MAAPSVSGLTILRTVDLSVDSTGLSGSDTISTNTGNNDFLWVSNVTNNDTEYIEIAFDSTADLTNKLIVFAVNCRLFGEDLRVGLYTTNNTDYRTWETGYTRTTARFDIAGFCIDPTNTSNSSDTGTFNNASVAGLRFEWRSTTNTAGLDNSGFSWGTANLDARNIYSIPYEGLTLSGGEVADTASVRDIVTYLIDQKIYFDPSEGIVSGFSDFVNIPFSINLTADLMETTGVKAIIFSDPTPTPSVDGEVRVVAPQDGRLFVVDTTAANTFSQYLISESTSNGFQFRDDSATANQWNNTTISNASTIDLGVSNYNVLSISAIDQIEGGNTLDTVSIETTASIGFEWNGTASFTGVCSFSGSAGHYINFPSSLSDGATFDATNISFGTPTTNLFRCDIGAGKTLNINVALGSGITASDVTVVSGSVVVSEPSAPLLLPNAEDGTRVLVNRIETITFDATDINTSTDEITLTGNQFSASSFPTLVRLTFASDATLPTSSPQIVNGGLYFVKSVSSDLVTLSVTEGGATVDFTAQGTDGASAFCTATGFTELDNSVVSGGSGYSSNFVISNGTALLIKAADWASSGGTASAGSFFQTTVSWSGTSGASILDAVGRNVAPDTTHNQIASLTSIALSSQVVNASGTAVTEITPISDGSTLSGVTIALEGVGRVEINANDADGILPVVDLYMYAAYYRSTEAGIRIMFGGSDASVIATNIYNFVTNNIQFDNTNSSVPLSLVGAILRDGQGRSLVASMTNPIAFNVATTGTGAIIGDAGLSSSESAILTRIDGLIEDSGGDRFTAKALETSPTNITSIAADAITASAIAADAVTEIQSGLATSASVSSIPTNPLLTTDSRLDNLDAAISSRSSHSAPDLSNLDVAVSTRSSHAAPDLSGLSTFNAASDQVIVTTNNDKTGYSLTQAFPPNFSSLGINGSGHISRVILTDTTTTNTDMRGTDGANTTAPDNASIADILVDTGTTIPNLLADIPVTSEFEARTLPAADYFDPSADTVARVTLVDTTTVNTDMRGTDSALTALPTIPSNWLTADGIASDAVTEIQSGLGTSASQSTIIANIAALNDSDATAANQTSILTLVTDLHQFKGLDASFPLSVDTSSNVATVNGKTLTQATAGDTVTTTRS